MHRSHALLSVMEENQTFNSWISLGPTTRSEIPGQKQGAHDFGNFGRQKLRKKKYIKKIILKLQKFLANKRQRFQAKFILRKPPNQSFQRHKLKQRPSTKMKTETSLDTRIYIHRSYIYQVYVCNQGNFRGNMSYLRGMKLLRCHNIIEQILKR